MSTLTTSIQQSIGSPSHGNHTNKRNKSIQIGIEEVKLSLYTDDMILYIENPKDATQKLLKLINEFSKVAGNQIKIQKLVAFLYTDKEISEKEYKNTYPLKSHPQH
uniref:Reverse transcriptase domain-containing protein n=1 Tax=Sus scrofa TaxID=9823 RepID=A0A8D0YH60_PIG